jgi:hypothetical protein
VRVWQRLVYLTNRTWDVRVMRRLPFNRRDDRIYIV